LKKIIILLTIFLISCGSEEGTGTVEESTEAVEESTEAIEERQRL